MTQPTIPTYYSHSYRPEDREINRLFMGYFWQRGFAFTVDPESIPLSTTQLAVMMRDSACFNWKPYASATAAAFTRFLIGDLWPQPPRK